MKTWVLTYNDLGGNSLSSSYETIEGKSAMDALLKRFGRKFQRLTGDAGRYANVILVRGYFRDNNIHYEGKYQRLCYGIL